MYITMLAHYYERHMMDYEGWGFVMMTLLIIVAAIVVVFAIKTINNSTSTGHSRLEPLDIAKTRYANGEITKEQFNEIKKELKS